MRSHMWHIMMIDRDMAWCKRNIKVNKTGPFVCYPCLPSTTNIQFEPSKDHLLLIWQWYNRVSCHLLAVALTSPVTLTSKMVWTFSHLLSPSRDFAYKALLLFSVQHWKAGNGPEDEAMISMDFTSATPPPQLWSCVVSINLKASVSKTSSLAHQSMPMILYYISIVSKILWVKIVRWLWYQLSL